MADDRMGVDDSAAARYDALAAHYRAAAGEAKTTQERILAGARARRASPPPLALSHEQRVLIATFSQWNKAGDLVTNHQAAALVGDEDVRHLPVALEADTHHRYPAMYRFGDVAAVGGDLPAPTRVTRAVLQEHTR